MIRRRTYRSGQLRPLAERMNEVDLDRRQYRINARRKMAMATGIVRQVTAWARAIQARSIWGRLKFAFLGR